MSKKHNSYGVEITRYNPYQDFKNTLRIYQEAVRYICDVVLQVWEDLCIIDYDKERVNYIEKLIHNTENNTAKYDFDKKFYKFPSYFRRAAIKAAIGHISSYQSNLANYEEERYQAISNGEKFTKKRPTLNLNINMFPVLYKNNMYQKINDTTFLIKVYRNHDWVYVKVSLRKNDIDYIKKHCVGVNNSPVLEFSYNKFYLRFSNKIAHRKLKKEVNKILSVDLGVNTDAVCTVMQKDGTIIGRHFINDTIDKDHLFHLLNRKKKLQSISGNYKYAPQNKITTKIKCYSKNIENQTVSGIIKLALLYDVDCIVFENLKSFKGKGSDKIHHWRKQAIIRKVCAKIHIFGIHYATINPKNTSKLAFDGSGEVKRGVKGNYSICKFTTGKEYNCDLNASYNIGARYFIKEIKKATSEKKWSDVVAKVPSLQRRTDSTYNSFLELLYVV